MVVHFTRYTEQPYPDHAVLVVNGQLYWEWESVYVKHQIMAAPPYTFRFTCSEQTPWPESWAYLRIRPPDECTVFLDGIQAIEGHVITRQVYYDGNQHMVEIQGIGRSGILPSVPAQSQTGEYKNETVNGIAQALTKAYGIEVSNEGPANDQKLDRFSLQPGESAQEAITRAANQAGAFITSNTEGGAVLFWGSTDTQGDVIEGYNILEGREVIHSLMGAGGYSPATQMPGTDEAWGAAQNLLNAQQGGSGQHGLPGNVGRFMAEMPINMDMLKQRARVEDNVSDNDEISVTIVTQGWHRPRDGNLWERGQKVFVDSPMLIMKRDLILKAVTFSQDNSGGTRSTLELVNRLGGYAEASPG